MLRRRVMLAWMAAPVWAVAFGASCATGPAPSRADAVPARTEIAAPGAAGATQATARRTVSLLDRGMLVAGRQAPSPWRAVDLGGGVRPARVTAGPALAGCRGWGLEIQADGAATMLARPVTPIPASASPILRWSWKVDHPVGVARLDRKDKDDAAGRVFVGFRYEPARASAAERFARALRSGDGQPTPGTSLCYVWSANEPVGTVLPSPYTDHVRVIVLQRSAANGGAWVTEERDIVADYVRAFGRRPPPLERVAVMADTDQTGARAVACFRDIAVSVLQAAGVPRR